LYTLKTFTSTLGINNINVNLNLNIDLRKYFIFNNNFKSFELNNTFLILGTNPKIDSPILNIKIKHLKYKLNKKINICYIGNKIILNYDLIHIGINTSSLVQLLYGKLFFCKILKKVYNVICLFSIGFSLFFNNLLSISLDVLSFFLKKQHFICNYITLFSSDVSVYDLGIVSYYYSKSIFINNNNTKMSYLLGVDYNNFEINNSLFNIYHGHHGNIGLKNSNIILPSNTFIENSGLYINCEGRLLVSNVIVNKKHKINNNESILYNLFNYVFFKKKHNINLKKLFLFFFYKNNFLFTKFKFVNKIYFSLKPMLYFLNIFLVNRSFTIDNDFFNMDVFNKSSYYILKLKNKYNKTDNSNFT
jgi:hypothetical protein